MKIKENIREGVIFTKVEEIINEISDVIIFLDVNLKINYVNEAFLRTFNTNIEGCFGKYCYDFFYSSKEPCNNCSVIEVIKKGYKSRVIKKVIKNKTWNIKILPILDVKRNVFKIVEVAQDITSQVQLEGKLKYERNQFLNILNGIDEAIYISDPYTYEIIFVNKYLQKLLKKDPTGGICYREFQGLNRPCDFCTNNIILANKYSTYKWEYHNSLLNRDYLIFDRIMKWKDGRDVRFEIAIDVTERKGLERAFNESEEKYKTLFDNIGDAVIISDLNGSVIEINKRACEFLGYERDEFYNVNIQNIILNNKKDIFGNKSDLIIETKLKNKNGDIIPVEIVKAFFKCKKKIERLSF